MNTIKGKTMELLQELPPMNSVTTYGSGYFKQTDDTKERKTKDLIVSVDNPSKWHAENLLKNPYLYQTANVKNLIDPKFVKLEDSNCIFPSALGCFFATFEGEEYKFIVVDKRLLYKDLEWWSHFSLAGRFQKETTLLIDESNGVLPELMKKNYEGAVKSALLMHPEMRFDLEDYYKTIAKLSYLGDIRTRLHCENKNKINNIVEGSKDFFEETYGSWDDEFHNKVYKAPDYQDKYLINKINELPNALKYTLLNTLSDKQLNNPKIVAKAIRKFFTQIDTRSSVELALRCHKTAGSQKTMETITGKIKKGMTFTKNRG